MTATFERYYRYALWLGFFTVFYNLFEGLISIFFGVNDEALTLFGFGIDSFIEVISGIGIVAMVYRIQRNPDEPRSQFERTALRITGTSFYLLAVGLVVTAIFNVVIGHKPETTLPGLIISLVSNDDVGAGFCQAQSGAGDRIGSHPGGCQLHTGLHLHVTRSAGSQSHL